MKKTILISIIASNVLFAATVNNLDIDQDNLSNNGTTITNATVDQGQTNISGTANVDGLTILQNTDGGTAGNHIDGVTITGTGTPSDLLVNQGSTTIVDSNVNNVELNSNNLMKSGTTIMGMGLISQGTTTVLGNSSTLANVKTLSTNTITNSDVDNSSIRQAALVVNESNTTDSNLANIDIQSTNIIARTTVGESTLEQAVTIITNGSTVTGLETKKHNVSRRNEILNNSIVTQGLTIIDNSTVNGIDQIVRNRLRRSTEDNSSVEQGSIRVTNNSDITNLRQRGLSRMINVNTENATVQQNAIDISNSTVTNFGVGFNNTIQNVDMVGSNNSVVQGKLVVGDSNLTGAVAVLSEIHSTNRLTDADLDNTSIIQSSTSILNSSDVSNLRMRQTNTIEAIFGVDSNLTSATITQAETLIDNSIVNRLDQVTDNLIGQVTVDNSTVQQAKIEVLANSNVANLTINTGNTIINSEFKNNANLSQNGLKIDNSTVSDLSISQDNLFEDATLDNATLTQGLINIL